MGNQQSLGYHVETGPAHPTIGDELQMTFRKKEKGLLMV